MSMRKSITEKSVIFSFDGFSENYRAFMQGAFVGKFIVPSEHAHLVRAGDELNTLREMYQSRRFDIVLRGYRTIE